MMFRVTGSASLDCEGHSRRSFVQAGVLGLGGLSLADYLHCRAQAANSAPAVNREADNLVHHVLIGGVNWNVVRQGFQQIGEHRNAAGFQKQTLDLKPGAPQKDLQRHLSLDDEFASPGWELEHLGESLEADDGAPEGSSEDSIMAATYGLAPPPRPRGVRVPENPGFSEALQEAKVRDEAFRRMQDATESEADK